MPLSVRPSARLCAQLRVRRARSQPSVAVWGDSFGAELAVGLGEIAARQGKAVRELTASSCPPSLSYNRWDRPGCAAYNRATLAALTGDANIRTIVLAADYDGYDQDRLVILQGLRQAALKLRVARKRIVLVYPVPRPTFDVPQALGMLAWQHRDSASWGPPPESVGPGTPTVRYLDALAGETGAAKLVPANAFCSGEHCETQGPAGAPLYFDDKHLSLAGARLLLSRQSPAWIFAE